MTNDVTPSQDEATAQLLEQARVQGLPSIDPMRWRRIEALARRMTGHQGTTLRLLQARLQQLVDELTAAADRSADQVIAAPTPRAQPLHALLARLNDAAPASAAPNAVNATRDLNIVRQHRAAWTQLRAEQRVAQSHSALPKQAGPLNSQLLLHRALTLMRETSPGYLQHFTSQAEALMWLERSQAKPAPKPKAPARKPAAPKAGGRVRRS